MARHVSPPYSPDPRAAVPPNGRPAFSSIQSSDPGVKKGYLCGDGPAAYSVLAAGSANCWVALAPAASRTIAAQRARPQAKARTQRRRNVAHRLATVAAAIVRDSVRAQPNAASLTLRIDALHRPSRHVLHGFPLLRRRAAGGRASGKLVGGFCFRSLVVSSKNVLDIGVRFPHTTFAPTRRRRLAGWQRL
jgi:hypothetical protein